MAYKFQLGAARLSGSVIQEGDVTAEAAEVSASTIALADASGIAGAGLVDNSGSLDVADLGITNGMLSGAIEADKLLLTGSEMIDFNIVSGSGEFLINSASFSASVDDVLAQNSASILVHFSSSDTLSIDMNYDDQTGVYSANALVDAAALEITGSGIRLKNSISGSRTFEGDVTVEGDLIVTGSLTYVNTTNLAITDALITVGSGSTAFAVDYGLEFGALDGGWASIKTAQEDLDGDTNDDDIFKFSNPLSSSLMATQTLYAETIYGNLAGGIIETVQTVTGGAEFNSLNPQIICNFATDDAIALPAPADMEGKVYRFKKVGAGNVQLNPSGSATIDGAASITLESPYAAVSIVSDGTNYYVM